MEIIGYTINVEQAKLYSWSGEKETNESENVYVFVELVITTLFLTFNLTQAPKNSRDEYKNVQDTSVLVVSK